MKTGKGKHSMEQKEKQVNFFYEEAGRPLKKHCLSRGSKSKHSTLRSTEVCREHVQEEREAEGREENNTYYWKLSWTGKLAKKFHSLRTLRTCADPPSRPHEKYLLCTCSLDHRGEKIMKFIFETQDNTETQLFLLDNNHSSNELWIISVSDILASGRTRVHEYRHQLSWCINDAFLFSNPLTRILGQTQFPHFLTKGICWGKGCSLLSISESVDPEHHLAGPCSIPSVSYELLQITVYMDFEPPF